jgi:hypothetical protein
MNQIAVPELDIIINLGNKTHQRYISTKFSLL